jgi:hypothetical protein
MIKICENLCDPSNPCAISYSTHKIAKTSGHNLGGKWQRIISDLLLVTCYLLPLLREKTASFDLGHCILAKAVKASGTATRITIAVNHLYNLGFA